MTGRQYSIFIQHFFLFVVLTCCRLLCCLRVLKMMPSESSAFDSSGIEWWRSGRPVDSSLSASDLKCPLKGNIAFCLTVHVCVIRSRRAGDLHSRQPHSVLPQRHLGKRPGWAKPGCGTAPAASSALAFPVLYVYCVCCATYVLQWSSREAGITLFAVSNMSVLEKCNSKYSSTVKTVMEVVFYVVCPQTTVLNSLPAVLSLVSCLL